MIAAVLIVASVIVFLLAWRRAYREAKQDERLDRLRGIQKGRYNHGEHRFERWNRD